MSKNQPPTRLLEVNVQQKAPVAFFGGQCRIVKNDGYIGQEMSLDMAISYQLEAPKKTSSRCSNNFCGPVFISSIHIFKTILQIFMVPISALFWMALII